MPLYTKLIPTQPNDKVTNDRIVSLSKKQNFVFGQVIKNVTPGISTAELADIARIAAKEIGIEFSFRRKFSFPEDISICRNHEIMNGIPKRDSIIMDGDLVKIAIGTNESMSAYCCQNWTVLAGTSNVSTEKSHLMSTTMNCLEHALKMCTENTKISTIVAALSETAKTENIVLSSSFVGHMIGKEPFMHPQFVSPKGLFAEDFTLTVGTTFSLLALGHPTKPQEKIASDKWTIVEKERFPSTVFSHLVTIGTNGPEILTATYPKTH